MKKRAVLLAAVLTAGLAACGTGQTQETTGAADGAEDGQETDTEALMAAAAVTSMDELTFPVGQEVSGAFTGTAYLIPMLMNDEVYNFPQTNNVTFEPGARSYWHSHGGMILVGTGGVGFYQEE